MRLKRVSEKGIDGWLSKAVPRGGEIRPLNNMSVLTQTGDDDSSEIAPVAIYRCNITFFGRGHLHM